MMAPVTDKSRRRISDASRELANALNRLATGFDTLNTEDIVFGTCETMAKMDRWRDVVKDAADEVVTQ